MTPDMTGKIMALSCALLWSFAVILYKQAGESISPNSLNLYKTIISTLLMLPLFVILGISLFPSNVSGREWLIILGSGVLGIAVADSLFFKSLNLLGAGMTAIVDCLYSPFVIILSWVFLTETIGPKQVGGAALIITAILVGTLKKNNGRKREISLRQILTGILAGAMAMLTMAISIVMMKPILSKTSAIWVTEVRLFGALGALLLLLLFNPNRAKMISSMIQKRNWKSAFPGTILGNFLAMILWITAFKLTDVSSAAILNQTNTIFIVILASVLLREAFTIRRLLATILAFSGSILVLTG